MSNRTPIYISLFALLLPAVLTGCGPQTVSVPVYELRPCPALAPEVLCGDPPPVAAQNLSALADSVIQTWEWGASCQAEATAWREAFAVCQEETKGDK